MLKSLYLAAAALAAVAAVMTNGCSQTAGLAGEAFGSAQLSAAAAPRAIQFLVGDIHAVKVTVTDAASDAVVATADFTGTSLGTHLINGVFSCTIDHLKVKDGSNPLFTYKARVETYLESNEQTLIGTSLSDAFSVSAGLTPASIALPQLTLVSTPVGSASTAVGIVDTPAPAVVIR